MIGNREVDRSTADVSEAGTLIVRLAGEPDKLPAQARHSHRRLPTPTLSRLERPATLTDGVSGRTGQRWRRTAGSSTDAAAVDYADIVTWTSPCWSSSEKPVLPDGLY